MTRRSIPKVAALSAIVLTSAMVLSACGGDGEGAGGSTTATGPINIWLSNNEQEVVWGKAAVEAWNSAHPDQVVTAQEIPAGKSSEEVIGSAIAAGNAPCLVYNTAPGAVAGFQQQGGLVDLNSFSDGVSYIEARSGDNAKKFQSADGHYYQLPWKSNPVVIFYNKDIFKAAGLDPENPNLSTYSGFLDASRKIVSSGASKYAIYPSTASDFYQSWFDYYPLFAAESNGQQLLEDGKETFTSDAANKVLDFWHTLYTEKLAGQETYTGDSFADGVSAMSIAGPWAVAYFGDKINWGTVPVPTSAGTAADQTYTFDDSKNVSMFSACTNQATAWEFLKFSTSLEQDNAFIDTTGQIPLRDKPATVFADYFTSHPQYAVWADQAAHTVPVPTTVNSTEIWQTFRDGYLKSVVLSNAEIEPTMADAATKVNKLASEQ